MASGKSRQYWQKDMNAGSAFANARRMAGREQPALGQYTKIKPGQGLRPVSNFRTRLAVKNHTI